MRPNPGAYAPGSYNLKPERSSVSELRSPPDWKTLIFAFGAYDIQGLKKGSKIQHSKNEYKEKKEIGRFELVCLTIM